MRGCQDCYNSLSIFSWPVGTQGENRLALYFPPVKLPCQQCCRYLLLNYQLQSSDLETQQLQLQLPRFLWEEKFGSDLVWAWQSAPGQVIIIEFENWNYQSVSLCWPTRPVESLESLPSTRTVTSSLVPSNVWPPEHSPDQLGAWWSCENKSGLIFINHYKVLAEEIH